MAEPASVRTDPYADFPKQPYSIITDDFCHNKLLVIKPTLKTDRSTIKIKETVALSKGSYAYSDELKLWFNLPKAGSLYSKVKSGDYIKIHYEDEPRTISGKQVFFYGGINTNRSLDLLSFKLGVGHDSEHCHSDNRIKVNANKGNYQYFWYSRTMVYHGNFRLGLVTCFDVLNRNFQKNNVLLGYNVDSNTQAFFRAEVNGFRHKQLSWSHTNEIFDKVTFDVVRKINSNTTGAVQVGYDLRSQELNNVQGVVRYQTEKKEIVKVGVNKNLSFSLLIKKPLNWWNNLATFSAGVSTSQLLKDSFNLKTGFEVALNL